MEYLSSCNFFSGDKTVSIYLSALWVSGPWIVTRDALLQRLCGIVSGLIKPLTYIVSLSSSEYPNSRLNALIFTLSIHMVSKLRDRRCSLTPIASFAEAMTGDLYCGALKALSLSIIQKKKKKKVPALFVKMHAANSSRLLCNLYRWQWPRNILRPQCSRKTMWGVNTGQSEPPDDPKMIWCVKNVHYGIHRVWLTVRMRTCRPNGSLIWVDRPTIGSPASTITHLTRNKAEINSLQRLCGGRLNGLCLCSREHLLHFCWPLCPFSSWAYRSHWNDNRLWKLWSKQVGTHFWKVKRLQKHLTAFKTEIDFTQQSIWIRVSHKSMWNLPAEHFILIFIRINQVIWNRSSTENHVQTNDSTVSLHMLISEMHKQTEAYRDKE